MKFIITLLSIFTLFLFDISNANAQENLAVVQKDTILSKKDSIALDRAICEKKIKRVSKESQFLKNKPYAYIDAYAFRLYNTKDDYLTLQLGKNKGNSIFIYLKVFKHNICFSKKDVFEFNFTDGTYLRMNNDFNVNCEGVIISQFSNNFLKKILKRKIKSIRIYSFETDFEFHFSSNEAEQFNEDINCLLDFRF